ncbi:hypothetical protein TcWFU_008163 [Taenia crassiceps]|uniref:Senescence-associated protein n=1 Tax=Taenia crassiceps TaxID=6207 RepID=A0ABR4PZC5_9CEST
MIGRADIEGSKSDVAMNAWPPQASYPCGHAFTVCIRTENQNQVSFCPSTLRQVSVLAELTLGHLRYDLTDVPPQSNSPPDNVFRSGRTSHTPTVDSTTTTTTTTTITATATATATATTHGIQQHYSLARPLASLAHRATGWLTG